MREVPTPIYRHQPDLVSFLVCLRLGLEAVAADRHQPGDCRELVKLASMAEATARREDDAAIGAAG